MKSTQTYAINQNQKSELTNAFAAAQANIKLPEKVKSLDLTKYSTNLLVECILQHLDSSVVRHSINVSVSSGTTETARQWVKLSETLIQCLKHDLKFCRTERDNIKCCLVDRKQAASIICEWTKDLKQLKSTFESDIKSTVVDERIMGLYNFLLYLAQVSEYVYERCKEEKEEERKTVYLFEDK